ncbi:DNA mismatch repair protein MutS [Arthrobacter livingstonensis]|uniref:DNA mismatch repair protein MutS n=1 Tax=Arthrobacter livingstonensis TaxID=670078 RepID=A0A2V5L1J3_9MICC|nr:DNA mismatch repair protein MutS [Arthrobacter livingstonensis]PYI65151.1 DNA mismatch repair protein MutS [Arthrobacter livingstonensis]
MLSNTEPAMVVEPGTKSFSSILFMLPQAAPLRPEQQSFLADLQLNHVIQNVTAGREPYDLVPLFLSPLASVEEITYRHQVISDLEDGVIRAMIDSWARSLQEMRSHLVQAAALRYQYQREDVFVVAAECYCSAVEALRRDLDDADPTSPGLLAFRDYVRGQAASEAFHTLGTESRAVLKSLKEIRYCLRIKGSRVTVSRYDGQTDHAAEVQETFQRFQQHQLGAFEDKSRTILEMDHLEAMIMERAAKLFPDVFASLDRFFQDNQDFADEVMLRFDREIQFYLAYLDHAGPLADAGLHFCLPTVSTSRDLRVEDTFDLALAHVLAAKHRPVVCNDFRLRAPERIFVVSGPNQGGKTTFARTIGQLHYLASLGLPVPGTRAELFLPDKIFTHFERGENTADLRGN